MLSLLEGTPLDMLRQFSVHFDADLTEEFDAAKFSLNNHKGKGYISLYEVFPGLTAWIYNIRFKEDLEFVTEFSDERPYYFGYHHSGYQLQKFPHEENFKRIEQRQNFIIKSEPNTFSEFVIPKNIDFKSCYLILNPLQLKKHSKKGKRLLETNLNEIFKDVSESKPYRYFGDINAKLATYTDIIINNKRTDIVGRLLVEGAILNMLAAQIESHDIDTKTNDFRPNLTNAELSKITDLGEYIKVHISEKLSIQKLSQQIPITEKKLQAGVRFLYGHSVNQYITNMRMEMAKELILNTDLSISEICYRVGYSSRSHFSKKFLEQFDLSPTEYRDNYADKNLLFEISYRSTAKDNISSETIDEIVGVAREMNKKFDITGSLIFHNDMFFQLIEGKKKDILKLYDNIKKDKRHKEVVTIWKGYKLRRDFSDWHMALLSENGLFESKKQGDIKTIELSHLLGDVDDKSIAAKNLWQKVRNVIKISS